MLHFRCACLEDGNSDWKKDYGTMADDAKKGLKILKVGDTGHQGEDAIFEVGPIVCQKTTLGMSTTIITVEVYKMHVVIIFCTILSKSLFYLWGYLCRH